jgi:hypothetical protein
MDNGQTKPDEPAFIPPEQIDAIERVIEGLEQVKQEIQKVTKEIQPLDNGKPAMDKLAK